MTLRDGCFTSDGFSNLLHTRDFGALSMVNSTAFVKENPGNGSTITASIANGAEPSQRRQYL